MYKEIPILENGTWTTVQFGTKEEFRDKLVTLFKEPGKYNFSEISFMFNEQAKLFNQNKAYCFSPDNTKDYITYWDEQKNKCRNGTFFKEGTGLFYLPREYYMWLNFLPIFNKEIQAYGFADVRDAQYHLALYELLAELFNKHAALVKKRQIASSYYHMAKLISQIWFEAGITLKIGALNLEYVAATWKFLDEYKSFLNSNTAWYRPFNPDKPMSWQQQIEIKKSNRKSMKGLKGIIKGLTFEKDPVKGVGGPCRYFFMEEAGIEPTMNTTVQYLYPAMRSGHLYTGQFIAAGSVGDLDQCEPLKQMILYPEGYEIYPVETNLIDEKGTIGKAGLFIPEQWSMPPYIDQYGNSLVEEALKAMDEEFERDKRNMTPADFQLKKSQHPRNIAEAFAARKEAIFPLHLVSAQQKRIEEKTYPYEFVDLSRDAEGHIKVTTSEKLPIIEWPVQRAMENKEGVIVVWERPASDIEFGDYYASIDPVAEGKTTSSESLCAIYVLKRPRLIRQVKGQEVTVFTERDKIVAAWCGRFDDINKTHQRLEMIVEWYNAWTIIENNWTGFIQHLQNKGKQKYLAHKEDMIFIKEQQLAQNVYQEYGWKNMGQIFKGNILSYGIEYLSEELEVITKPDGGIVKTIYGVERIPDPMLLKEMAGYQHGVNVDRLVAYCALVAFSRVQDSKRMPREITVSDKKSLDKSDNLFKLVKNPFTHMGESTLNKSMQRPIRNPFRNLK